MANISEVTNLPFLALTVRQPWTWSIMFLSKDIENRDWPTRIRGRIFLHAAKGMTCDEWDDGFHTARGIIGQRPEMEGQAFPKFVDLPRGGIVGTLEIVGCVTSSASPWFFGRYGFVLRDPRPIPFVPCKGALGFWRVPQDVLEQVRI